MNYSTRTCLMCGCEYHPTGSFQRWCVNCKCDIVRRQKRESAHLHYPEHKEAIAEKNREWKSAHPDYSRAAAKKRYAADPERARLANRTERLKHPDVVRAATERWRLAHLEQVRATSCRQKPKRRTLGFIPLNAAFGGAEGHHVDKEYVIYIPKELHRSIPHDNWTGQNMDAINTLAFNYLSYAGRS